MRTLLRVTVVVAGALLWAELAHTGEVGVVCNPGTFSVTGFTPCSPCPQGTFTAIFGSSACMPCPAGSAAPVSGASVCTDCNCDDLTACTLDTCNATTAQCSAEAVPECELVTVAFAGLVDGVFDFPAVTIGMPIEGSYTVDPLAPDDAPLDPGFGRYPSAARSLDVRVGQPVVLEAIDPGGNLAIFDPPSVEDVYLVDFGGIQVTTPPNVPGDGFSISLRDDTRTAVSSDALVVEPLLASFGVTTLAIVLSVGDDATISTSDFTLTAPEPDASALASIAAAALASLRRRVAPHQTMSGRRPAPVRSIVARAPASSRRTT